METYEEIDKIVLFRTTKHCLHSALRYYYFKLRDLPPEKQNEFMLLFQECKRLLVQVFGDSVVKSDNTHDLPF